MHIAMLHFAPAAGSLATNMAWIEQAAAAAAGADLLMMPELAVTGYGFAAVMGSAWIEHEAPSWLDRIGDLARRHCLNILATLPVHDPATGLLHNAASLLGRDGAPRGTHCKVAVIPGGAEAWSAPGTGFSVIEVDERRRVGVAICADAALRDLPMAMDAPDMVLSPAAWSPGLHGPSGEWERLSGEARAPVLVCNRSGHDGWDFSGAESVLAVDGRRLASWSGEGPTLIHVLDPTGPVPGWSVQPLR